MHLLHGHRGPIKLLEVVLRANDNIHLISAGKDEIITVSFQYSEHVSKKGTKKASFECLWHLTKYTRELVDINILSFHS